MPLDQSKAMPSELYSLSTDGLQLRLRPFLCSGAHAALLYYLELEATMAKKFPNNLNTKKYTVPTPLMNVASHQEFCFWDQDFHIKNSLMCLA